MNLVNYFLKKMINQRRKFYLEKSQHITLYFVDMIVFWPQIIKL